MPIPVFTSLTLEQANAICAGALSFAAAQQLAPLAIVVLDAGGAIVTSLRQDGCGPARMEVALAKGHGAIGMGMPSAMMAGAFQQNPGFVAAIAAATGGKFAAQPGGVLILSDGVAIGAVGISGDTGDKDDAAAVAGVNAAGLIAAGS